MSSERARATVEALALRKKLPASHLRFCGLQNHPLGIEFIHLDFDGSTARSRIRRYLDTSHPTIWSEAKASPMIPFGALHLDRWRKDGLHDLWIAEGETDALTLRHHSHAALSIPGASMAHLLRVTDIEGFGRLLVAQDSDIAGAQFAQSVKIRALNLGFSCDILFVTFGVGLSCK